ncbi:MAG: PQQ-binding-like beta-propeller repeat protein [Candidatus Sulfotelmatobacter sp.]
MAEGKLRPVAIVGTFRLPARQTTYGYASALLGSDGTIYLLLDHSVITVSPTGKLIWQIDLPGPNIANGFLTLASDGTLYVVTDTGVIHSVQTASHGPAGNSGGGS